MKRQPNVQQYDHRTGKLALGASRLMQKVVGNTVPPVFFQRAIDDYLGRSVTKTMNLFTDDPEQRDLPYYMRLVMNDFPYDVNERDRFYRDLEALNRKRAGFLNRKEGDPPIDWTGADNDTLKAFNQTKTKLDEFGKVIRFLREEGTDSQKANIPIYYAAQDRAIKELYQALGR